MAPEPAIHRYRRWYTRLLGLYPEPYRRRFAEGMEQTFSDLCRERTRAGKALAGLVVWVFVDTSMGIIREHWTSSNMQRRLTSVALGIGVVLVIPPVLTLLATWRWRPGAMILAVVLVVGGVRLLYKLVTQGLRSGAYRWAVGVSLVTVFLLVWVNAAVGGILGDDPANMMYFGVLLVGLVGATLARVEPRGMSRALLATAFAIQVVPAIALAIGTPAFENGVPAVFGLHAVFALLFGTSALLFGRAGANQP